MVKLAPSLPKEYDDNGLESNTRHLLGIYPKQEYVPVVALVRTKEITQTENFERVPKLEIVHVEIAIDEDDQEDVRELIRRLHDGRVQHVKQPLDLPDTEPTPAPVLELGQLDETGYRVVVFDEPESKFGVRVLTASGALAVERHALPQSSYSVPPPGEYKLAHLSGELHELARALIQHYEAGFEAGPDEDVVEAEVVDDPHADEQVDFGGMEDR